MNFCSILTFYVQKYIIITMETLTKKQKIFFEKLKESYSNRALASYEVLKNEFNFKSKNSIKQYIEVLVKKNFITIID